MSVVENKNTRIGTTMTPPPIPKRPLRKPAVTPVAANMVISKMFSNMCSVPCR